MLNKRSLPSDDSSTSTMKHVFRIMENQLATNRENRSFTSPIACGSLRTKFIPTAEAGGTLPIALDSSDFNNPV